VNGQAKPTQVSHDKYTKVNNIQPFIIRRLHGQMTSLTSGSIRILVVFFILFSRCWPQLALEFFWPFAIKIILVAKWSNYFIGIWRGARVKAFIFGFLVPDCTKKIIWLKNSRKMPKKFEWNHKNTSN